VESLLALDIFRYRWTAGLEQSPEFSKLNIVRPEEEVRQEHQWTSRRLSWWYEYFASYRSTFVNEHPDPYDDAALVSPQSGLNLQGMLRANDPHADPNAWLVRMHLASLAGLG